MNSVPAQTTHVVAIKALARYGASTVEKRVTMMIDRTNKRLTGLNRLIDGGSNVLVSQILLCETGC